MSCQKSSYTTNFITIKGKVIDKDNQPAINLPVYLSFISSPLNMGSLNFESRHNISITNTDSNGNFILKTTYPLARDKDDYYRIEAFGSNDYLGFKETINAKEAEDKRKIFLDTLKVDKLISVDLTIYHIGTTNKMNCIHESVDFTSFYESGIDSVIKRKCKIRANRPCIISWQTWKNNASSNIFKDTLFFTNLNKEYSISY
jgi:hypothetical protein